MTRSVLLVAIVLLAVGLAGVGAPTAAATHPCLISPCIEPFAVVDTLDCKTDTEQHGVELGNPEC